MLIALIARDKPGALPIRQENRAAHLDYLKASGDAVFQAGPLLNDAGEMSGSLVILNMETLSDAQDWAANDPYANAGLFDSVELIEWKKVLG
ncbi:YciI family protein [Rhodobacteraceae bacterium D3-12]|nr:YciI family protein [Rhodobacteraceae bacterium D3-12]